MLRIVKPPLDDDIEYPTSDGRPFAEGDLHRAVMFSLIQMLRDHFAATPTVKVSGNLLVFYERGNPRRHVAPDVFLVRGVPNHLREHFLIWHEGKAPEFVIEVTSKRTRKEDLGHKLPLYRDVLKVKECFLFDPRAEYLDPPLQGYRPVRGAYVPIKPVRDRLPSRVTGLQLEYAGTHLRLWEPASGRRLFSTQEAIEEAETLHQLIEARREAGADVERLRRETEELWHRHLTATYQPLLPVVLKGPSHAAVRR